MKCLTFNQTQEANLYLISYSLAFTTKYLEMTYPRLLRGKLAPGQEVDALKLFHDGHRIPTKRVLRDALLHALEGFALAKRTPNELVRFDLNYPASKFKGNRNRLTFYPEEKVTALCFDWHFGLHRPLESGVDQDRTAHRRGSPRYAEHERTSSCKHRTKTRLPMQNRILRLATCLGPRESNVLWGNRTSP